MVLANTRCIGSVVQRAILLDWSYKQLIGKCSLAVFGVVKLIRPLVVILLFYE
jgi:hypothetical protein